MSGWISSKLKVAESLLQQFDQQAAESLRKNEKLQSCELNYETPSKATEILPLKDQLKKKTPENKDLIGTLHNDHILNFSRDRKKEKDTSAYVNVNGKSSLTDSDWTELLSAPNKTANGGSRGLWKDGRRQGSSGSHLMGLVAKRSQKASKNSVSNSLRKPDIVSDRKVNDGGSFDGKPSDGEDSLFSDSMRSVSTVDLQSDYENTKTRKSATKDAIGSFVAEHTGEANDERNGEKSDSNDTSLDGSSNSTYENNSSVMVSPTADGHSDLKMRMTDDHNKLESTIGKIGESNAGLRKSDFTKRAASSSGSDGASDSETNSVSTSDSEVERKREEKRRRREQILAEKAAAKAIETIKERENKVARLEGEKQSLEKILEERAKQQAQEASELQTTMMETMEAVDLEKQKHNSTRMEALSRLAKLETENADLARSFAMAQWNLEVEVSRVAELRQQIELKEVTLEEIRRKISNSRQTGKKLVATKGVEFENEILEAEFSFFTDKVRRLQEKAKTLEKSIEMTRKEIEDPTEVEVELKRRLGQLTDHLIQKQAQVEGLSSAKAMLQFRIEAASRTLDENKSMLNSAGFPSTSSRDDLESGAWDLSNSKLRPMLENKLRSGKKHFSSLVWQLDYIFSAGAVFLRRNSAARTWAFIYLVCLHLWVLYILKSHSPVSEESRSGAVFSLENINNTGGI